MDDTLAIAHNNLGYVLYDQGKMGEAVAEWEKAVDSLSDDAANRQGRADCWAGLAIGYLAQGEHGKAKRAYQRAVGIDPNYTNPEYLAEEAFWSPKAIEAAEKLIPEISVEPSPVIEPDLPTA